MPIYRFQINGIRHHDFMGRLDELCELAQGSVCLSALNITIRRNVMQAIRNMEPAWEKICGRKFALTSRTITQSNGGTREVPCYQLTKTECLYIATKFNDEARAKLVLRREELEKGKPNLEKIFDKNRVENLKRKSLNSNAIGGYEEIMSKAFDF